MGGGWDFRGHGVLPSVVFVLSLAIPAVPPTVASVDPDIAPGELAVLRATSGAALNVARAARELGATDVETLDSLDMVTARLDARAARALARNVAVRVIASDGAVAASDGTISGVRVPTGKNQINAQHGVNEQDRREVAGPVTVAVVDSGVAESRELAGTVLARVDFVGDGLRGDPGGHGTFIAGLIAGTTTGVLPSARIVSLRVLNEQGLGRVSGALRAFDWLLKNRFTYGVRVVNLSWGAPQATSYHRDVLAAASEALWFSGLAVVAAAGNRGPSRGALDTPGADPFVITAGSLLQEDALPASDDRESIWSSRGPGVDGNAKPDVLAVGESVVSLRVPGSYLDRTFPERAVSETRTRMSGTSVAAAITAGVVAMIIARRTRTTPTEAKTALISTARRVPESETGAIDVSRALRWSSDDGSARANARVRPSALLLARLRALLPTNTLTWENVTWENVTWENITWESVTWESVTWEAVTWETVSWETRR